MGEIVDLRGVGPPRTGAVVVAAIAYPGPNELALRELTERRLVNRWLRYVIADRPEVAEQLMSLRPIELLMDRREADGGRLRLWSRLEARLTAGHIALPFILQQKGKAPPARFARRPTLMEAARIVLGEDRTAAAKHLLNRKFYPTLPVIHLAAAWAAMATREGVQGEVATTVTDLVDNQERLEAMLREAENLAFVLQASPLAIDPGKLIRFVR
jgi:hypothetical protein